VEGHFHFVAAGFDVVDRADADAHDDDLVPGIERIGLWEIGDHGVVGQFFVQLHAY
jgi:hypothetical protein